MVASCYRRSGNYAAALDKYKMIHMKFPDNIECILIYLTVDKQPKKMSNFCILCHLI